MKNFNQFEEKINIMFKDKSLLKQAFIHRSYINENPNIGLSHNERLEFLGDAVLEIIITEFLFNKYPDKTEGELTAYRAALVNTQSIYSAASELDMNDYLLLSKGEAKDIGKARQYILANTFEAVIGAIYIDQGYEAAKKFIEESLFHRVEGIVEHRLWQDNKSYFQEKAQEAVGITPSYSVLEEVGPDHDKSFTVGVFLGEDLVAKGTGRSKQDAEQEAAKNGLETKDWI